jgi:hypothetical protein
MTPQLKAVGLLVFLAVNPAQASSVTSEDIVSRVVKVLRDFQDQPAIVERALTALSVTSGVPSLLVSKGVVPLALAAIKDFGSNLTVRVIVVLVVVTAVVGVVDVVVVRSWLLRTSLLVVSCFALACVWPLLPLHSVAPQLHHVSCLHTSCPLLIYHPLVPCLSQVVTAAIAVLWCIAAAEEHHDLLTETALPTVLSTMTDHVEDARVQENCSGFLFSLSSTVRCRTRTAPSHLLTAFVVGARAWFPALCRGERSWLCGRVLGPPISSEVLNGRHGQQDLRRELC